MTPPGSPPPDTSRLGTGMVAAAWIVGLALVALLFHGWLEEQRNPNRDLRLVEDGPAEVVLQRNRQGHYVAPGRINGEPVEMLLDTGATNVSVPAGLAPRLGLERGAPQATLTANGVITTYRTRLDSVQLGGIVLENVRASINPAMSGGKVLLGMSFLGRLELVQRGDRLVLRPPEAF